MVLDDYRAVSEIVKFFSVQFYNPVAWITLWIENLCGPDNADISLNNLVYLAFPSGTQTFQYLVFVRNNTPWLQIKITDSGIRVGHD